MESILVIDDDSSLRERVSHYFGAQGFYVDTADDAVSGVRRLAQHAFDVILVDVAAVDDVRRLAGDLQPASDTATIITLCARDDVDSAMRTIREGADDFIPKPINLAELDIKIARAVEMRRLSNEGQLLRGERNLIYRTQSLVGKSPAIRSVLSLVAKVAASNSSVLLLGETGTGKELIAGAIHYNSPRARNAFVRVNCATLPDALLESELFGHERGAFTGADRPRLGRFELGNGGSVFLDEIADVSPSTQAKLLRVLQEHEFERLGSNRTVRVDVRIVAATNRDLESDMREGRFREDLYYRLNVVSVRIPPLREREGDVELLVDFFLRKYAGALKKRITGVDPAALRLLNSYRWPGNVRELANTMERAVLMAEAPVIRPVDLSLPFKEESPRAAPVVRLPPSGVKWTDVERDLLLQALAMSGWVQKGAADLLGLSTRVVNYKISKLGIRHPSWKQNK